MANENEQAGERYSVVAMRKASERLSMLVGNWIDHLPPVVRQEASDLLEELDATLSAPARNCDGFVDELDAQLAFLNEVWLISVSRKTMLEQDKYENWTDEMRESYGRWLLAPMTKQKP